ncbi:MAG: hypothetical protein NZ866_01585 [Patescibacteria group bacterium]|nr:hypothetical protein [Patescibacteria group bacterium]
MGIALLEKSKKINWLIILTIIIISLFFLSQNFLFAQSQSSIPMCVAPQHLLIWSDMMINPTIPTNTIPMASSVGVLTNSPIWITKRHPNNQRLSVVSIFDTIHIYGSSSNWYRHDPQNSSVFIKGSLYNDKLISSRSLRIGNHFVWTGATTFYFGTQTNQVYQLNINLGNNTIAGWIEVSLSSYWNYHSSKGRYTKRFFINRVQNHDYFNYKSSEVVAANGDITSAFKIGEPFIENNHVKIPIYEKTFSTPSHGESNAYNDIAIKVEGLVIDYADNSVNNILNSLNSQNLTPFLTSYLDNHPYLSQEGLGFMYSNVGIGTTTPQAKLHVIGDILSSATIIAQRFCLGNNCITGNWPTGGISYWILSGTNLYATPTNVNIGIGTTTPRHKLHVVGGLIAADNGITTGGTLRVNFDSHLAVLGGNVGIGTTTPQAKLHVNGNVRIYSSDGSRLVFEIGEE